MPRKVLVVDDDDNLRELFEHTLKQAGFLVRTAANGVAGLALLDVFTPDVIVTDMQMPAAPGLSVVEQVRQRAATRKTPIIAITAHEDLLQSAKDHPEVLGTIRKPFTADELVRAVSKAIEIAGT